METTKRAVKALGRNLPAPDKSTVHRPWFWIPVFPTIWRRR